MDLITFNIYNSIKAPLNRKITYLEYWMVIVHIPLLIGVAEYAIILAIHKFQPKKLFITNDQVFSAADFEKKRMKEMEELSNFLDKMTFIITLLIILLSNLVYWSIAFV